jgi:plastocyanin
MRRLFFLPALFVVALAACTGSSTGPSWTLGPSPSSEPPTSASPSGSAGASASASAPASASASAPASASASPSGGGGTTVTITAQGIKFLEASVNAPAGKAFTLHFDNKDPATPHNVEILDASNASLFKGQIVTGLAAADYQVPALTAGTYKFMCTVHPTMTGELKAG